MVTVNYNQKKFRFFLGDVNDFTNLGCIYFMDSVVSVGETSYGKRVYNLYREKKKNITINGHSLNVDPFKTGQFKSKAASFETIDHNAKTVSLTVARKNSNWTSKKSLLFFHLYDKQVSTSKDVKKILDGLARYTKQPVSNVLFIADHLEPHSLYLWKYLLTAFGKYEINRVLRITYRRIRLFSGIIIHNHPSSTFHIHK